MLPFQIKICGITSVQDALGVCQSHADSVGLNFYSPSSRYVDPSKANKIADAIRDANPSMKVVGVFVNMALAEIVDIAKAVGLDGIQLHGDEQPDCVNKLRSLINAAELELKLGIIRAIRVNHASSSGVGHYGVDEVARIKAEIERWASVGIDAVLLDAAVPGEFGGTGKVVDWAAVPQLNCTIPLVLAGGLKPDNVRSAIGIAKVQSVDVASGVEASPGVKDIDMVKRFAEEAASAF